MSHIYMYVLYLVDKQEHIIDSAQFEVRGADREYGTVERGSIY